MVNGHQPGAIMQAALNPQLQQLQQSLEAQKQQLLVQQQVLQQQVKPEAQQLNKQQILLDSEIGKANKNFAFISILIWPIDQKNYLI